MQIKIKLEIAKIINLEFELASSKKQKGEEDAEVKKIPATNSIATDK